MTTSPTRRTPWGGLLDRGSQRWREGQSIALPYQDGQDRVIEVRGQPAKALLALVEAEHNGCTAQQVASWAYRFAAYTHDLRHRYGLAIRTDREPHPHGWHGRHVLETPVEILSIEGIEALAA